MFLASTATNADDYYGYGQYQNPYQYQNQNPQTYQQLNSQIEYERIQRQQLNVQQQQLNEMRRAEDYREAEPLIYGTGRGIGYDNR